ncbi:MAG: hypothetical protein PHH71_03320 [Clostridia bacterium]|nr:hypothetical protein [Clostridia bacterium]MDD4409004.1 hypothetical protein [Clostridia bacterium]
MNKQIKKELKQTYKKTGIFLLITFPILCIVGFLLYYFIPSLLDSQFIVILIMVAVGGIVYLIMEIIISKKEKAKKDKPKKFDPFAD